MPNPPIKDNVENNVRDNEVNKDGGEDEEGTTTVIKIEEADIHSYRRLDQLLADKLNLSRSFVKKIFEAKHIEVTRSKSGSSNFANITLSLSKIPAAGTVLEILVPSPIPCEAGPENIPLDILYEDEHLLIINKPAGMVVHPAPGHYRGTLVNALLHHCPQLSGIGGVTRPGIVHRLDIGTTGVMVAAKTAIAHEELICMFAQHQVEKIYEAIVLTSVHTTNESAKNGETSEACTPLGKSSQGKIVTQIGRHPQNRLKMAVLKSEHATQKGKEAITNYQVITKFSGQLYHLQLRIETGRTHQIRVHLSSVLKAPILMDALYGKPQDQLERLRTNALKANAVNVPAIIELLQDYPYPLLHSRTLGLTHPITKKYLQVKAAYPSIFSRLLVELGSSVVLA
ncbi:MAG: RluA family pseudouridine synthase [Oligoflexia bacterium]|nr:RluA family pseudouridine synthase [Oligoflexia bacterium]